MQLQLKLGTSVRCSDGVAGTLADLVIDPQAKRVTHLVVQCNDEEETVRLVPVALAADGFTESQITLNCTLAELVRFDSVREFAYLPLGELPDADADWDVGVEDVFAMPTAGTDQLGDYSGELTSEVGVTYDRVPKGEVELRRASAVETADGHQLGHVAGFVVDDEDEITSLTMRRGHLWWRRDVSIPISSVETVKTDAVRVSLSRAEVGALPSVRAK